MPKILRWEVGEWDEKWAPGGVAPGQFGVLCGNWDGDRVDLESRQQIHFDLKSGPCHFLLLQEASESVHNYLMEAGTEEQRDTRGGGGGARSDGEEETRGSGDLARATCKYLSLIGQLVAAHPS